MTVAFTELLSGKSQSAATTQATASYTPPANHLILAALGEASGATSVAPGSVPTGNGLTWVLVKNQGVTSGKYQVTVWRAMGASPTTGALTFNGLDTNDSGRGWTILDCGSVDTSGTNGSGAVVQSAGGSAGTGTTATATLGAFGSANNGTVGFAVQANNAVSSPGTGFTGMTSEHNAGAMSFLGEYRTDNSTSVTETWTGSSPWAIVGIEVKYAAPAAAGKSQAVMIV